MTPSQQQELLSDMHAEIARLAALIDAPRDMLPRHNKSPDATWLSLEWREACDGDDEDGWYLSLMRNEDGQDWELAEVGAEHPEYLLYVIFDEISGKLARTECRGEERLVWFAAQEALLGRLNDTWRERTARRHSQMLKV